MSVTKAISMKESALSNLGTRVRVCKNDFEKSTANIPIKENEMGTELLCQMGEFGQSNSNQSPLYEPKARRSELENNT